MNFDHWWRLNAHKIFHASYYTSLSSWMVLRKKAMMIWEASRNSLVLCQLCEMNKKFYENKDHWLDDEDEVSYD